MARRPRGRQAATGTVTVVSPSDAGAGTASGTRQPKTTTTSTSAGDATTPDKGKTRQTIITAKDKPYVETKITKTGARKKPKPWGKQGDARKALKADDDRLWDPSKGIKMPAKPTLTRSQPDEPTSATSNRAARANINHKTPTTPTISEARLRKSRMAEMTYLVADTCDPDSFDRGGIVQVSYEASKSNTTTPKTSPNSQEQRGRKRGRGRNRNRDRNRDSDGAPVNGHWVNLASDLEFSQMVDQMDRQTPLRSPSPEFLEEPIRPPSNALLEWLASTEDKLLGRLIFQPSTASGNDSKRDDIPSHSGQTVAAETTDINDYCVQMLDQMMGRLYTPRPSCLFPGGSNGSVTDSVTLAGIGEQFR
ncbi:hypothetical protein V8F33_011280 [Rhypophila sp. PSN 637]